MQIGFELMVWRFLKPFILTKLGNVKLIFVDYFNARFNGIKMYLLPPFSLLWHQKWCLCLVYVLHYFNIFGAKISNHSIIYNKVLLYGYFITIHCSYLHLHIQIFSNISLCKYQNVETIKQQLLSTYDDVTMHLICAAEKNQITHIVLLDDLRGKVYDNDAIATHLDAQVLSVAVMQIKITRKI